MKPITVRILIGALFSVGVLAAQQRPIPVELLFGHQRIQGQITTVRSFGKGPFGLFNLNILAGDYANANKSENEVVSNLQLTAQVIPGLRVAGGAGFHFLNGFVPQLGLQWQKAGPRYMVALNPTLEFSAHRSLATIGIAELRPRLSDKHSLYFRVQSLYIRNLTAALHERSFLLLRAGATWGSFTPGLGFNRDFYGSDAHYKDNAGIFIRYNFQ